MILKQSLVISELIAENKLKICDGYSGLTVAKINLIN
jgi:hypothetical protein